MFTIFLQGEFTCNQFDTNHIQTVGEGALLGYWCFVFLLLLLFSLITFLSAENVAKQWGISREEQDSFALRSQQKCGAAIEAGNFRKEIVPVKIKSRAGSRNILLIHFLCSTLMKGSY